MSGWISEWPYWLRVTVLLGIPLAVLWGLAMAFIFNCTETGRQWTALKEREASGSDMTRRSGELKRRENDQSLWDAQRMSIIATRAPDLHTEIMRARAAGERRDQ